MISKDEAISKLKKAGYQILDDNSMVTVLIPKTTSLKSAVKELKLKLKEIDYDASFCVKHHKASSNGKTSESINTDSTTLDENEDDNVTGDSGGESLTDHEYEFANTEDEPLNFTPQEDNGQFSLGDFGIGV